MLTAVIMSLCTGLNWQRNIGRKSIVQQVHLVVALCVAAMSMTVWDINEKLVASFVSQWTNQKRPDICMSGRRLNVTTSFLL